jgi:NAD(P)H-flavin reductase
MDFVFGVRYMQDIFYTSAFDRWNQHGVATTLCLSQDANQYANVRPPYYHGRVTNYLAELDTTRYHEFYICGSPAMVREVRGMLAQRGIDKSQILFEQY